jgi:DNA helicase-2/ATP-dependent DNA helicase PcrA
MGFGWTQAIAEPVSSGPEPSSYQQAIYDVLANDTCNVVVEAVAGSGKTHTIREACKRLPAGTKALYLVFNKKNQVEAQEKLPGWIEARTLNGFGHSICCRHIGVSSPDTDKTANIFLHKVNDLLDLPTWEQGQLRVWLSPISRFVSLFKGAACFTVDAARAIYDDLADAHDITIEGNEEDFKEQLFEVYKEVIAEKNVRDFDDQIFAPVMLDLPFPRYDVVFVDESQDLNPCKAAMVRKLMQAGSRIMIVGDSRQAIYGFAGADVESMAKLKSMLNGRELPLSVNYRCSQAVIKEAQALVPHIQACDTAPVGSVQWIKAPQLDTKARDGDFILCRTSAPLVAGAMRFIRHGRKACVLGRDLGKGLKTIIQKLGPGDKLTRESIEPLDAWYTSQLTRLQRSKRQSHIAVLTDKRDTILALFEQSATLADALTAIDRIFSDTVRGVTFSTVHKAKGLEADNVFVLRPDLMPHLAAKKPWAVAQEHNLKYVAITRAKTNLYWVEQ